MLFPSHFERMPTIAQRLLLALLLLTGPTTSRQAFEVPEGPAPRIDGELSRQEWSGAAVARLRLALARTGTESSSR